MRTWTVLEQGMRRAQRRLHLLAFFIFVVGLLTGLAIGWLV